MELVLLLSISLQAIHLTTSVFFSLLWQEAKRKEIEAMERTRIEREKEEAAIADTMHNTKKKLLNDLAEDEAKREADVKKLQQLRDEEKKTLFTSLSSGKNTKYIYIL